MPTSVTPNIQGKIVSRFNNMTTDKNGRAIGIGDRVQMDDCEYGTIESFGGLGVYVKMDFGHQVIDWALDQVALAEGETPS